LELLPCQRGLREDDPRRDKLNESQAGTPVVGGAEELAIQLVASRVIFPQATLTGEQLQKEWWWVLLIIVPLVPMILVDIISS